MRQAGSGASWRLLWAGALATAALGVGYLGWTWSALEVELARRAGAVADLRSEIARQREFLRFLASPETRLVAMRGLRPSPAARGRIWWQGEAGGFFVAEGLPAAPAGRTYQLWAIAGGAPVSAGIFNVDPSGSGTLRVKPLPGVKKVGAFAVTLEPAGGLPEPSGPRYLASKAP